MTSYSSSPAAYFSRAARMPSNTPPPAAAQVRCPACGAAVAWTTESRFRPFCSERCKLIDFGAWLDGSRAIPGETAAPPDANEDDPLA